MRNSKSKLLTTDGRIKVGDDVVYNASKDFGYTGDKKYVKAKVLSIKKLDWSSNKAFEYHLDFGGYGFWVNNNKIRKLRKGEEVGRYKLGKFDVGERVYVTYDNWHDAEDETFLITGARMGYGDEQIEYLCQRRGVTFTFNEENLRRRKNPLSEGGQFNVGDSVRYIGGRFGNKSQISTVTEVYTLDDDPQVYYKLVGYYTMVMTDDPKHPLWAKMKPPKIIISANDPYGEEDWDDEE